jgi:hypothetical protein
MARVKDRNVDRGLLMEYYKKEKGRVPPDPPLWKEEKLVILMGAIKTKSRKFLPN